MKLCTSFVAALVIVAAGLSTAQAQILFSDNFDTYADQTQFNNSWTPMGCTGQGAPCTGNVSTLGGTLSQDTAVSNPNSILNHSPVGSPGSADSAERNFKNFTATPTLAIGDQLAWSFDFYDISPALAPYRQHANMQTAVALGTSPAGQLISMGLNNNQLAPSSGGQYYMARILGYSNPAVDPDGGPNETNVATNYIKLNDFDPTPLDSVADGPGARSEGWHNLKVVISTADGTSTDYNFFVDNVLSEHVNVVGTPRTYSHFRMGAGVSSTEDAYYDNFLLEYIPAAPGNDADFNGDGEIGAADYVIWRKHNPVANPNGTQETGDADGDDDVDDMDYDEWVETFGQGPGGSGGGGAVPEPSTLALLMLGVAAFAGRRRSR